MSGDSLRAMIVEASGRGFLNHYAHALALGLHNIEVDVRLLTGCRDELAELNVPFYKTACLKSGRAGRRCIRDHILREKPDLVHFQWFDNPLGALGLVRWIRRRGIRVIYTPHNILPHEKRWLLMPVYRKLYQQMDRIVARDLHLAWALEELLDIPRATIALLPGSPNMLSLLDRNEIVPGVAAKRKDEIRLLFFGHGCPRKGLDLLLQIIDDCHHWPGNFHLVVAGEGVLRGIPARLINRAEKKLRLTVVDRYIAPSHVARLFDDADLLVMPYLKLCKSPLLDLAAAFGLPVLKSDRVRGAFFVDGEHGMTFDHGDRSDLADRLLDTGWLSRLKIHDSIDRMPVESMNDLAARHRQLYAAALRGTAMTGVERTFAGVTMCVQKQLAG